MDTLGGHCSAYHISTQSIPNFYSLKAPDSSFGIVNIVLIFIKVNFLSFQNNVHVFLTSEISYILQSIRKARVSLFMLLHGKSKLRGTQIFTEGHKLRQKQVRYAPNKVSMNALRPDQSPSLLPDPSPPHPFPS